jgi:hypothetical protein
VRADLEAELMRRVHDGELARDVINDLLTRGAIASPKQGWRTLEKWCDKDWYDYGVSLDTGWMTDKAPCGRSVIREPVEPFRMSISVNGERHTTELRDFDSRGRRVVPSDAELLKAEVERCLQERWDALTQQPAKSPAEWRQIIEQRLRELGGDVAAGNLDAVKVQIMNVEKA